MSELNFKDLLSRLFGEPRTAPQPALTAVYEAWDEDSDGGELIPREDSSDPAPSEVVIGAPVAVIQRPSRSFSTSRYPLTAADVGRKIQLANRNLYRTRTIISVFNAAGIVVQIGNSEESCERNGFSLVSPAALYVPMQIEIKSIGEIWAFIADVDTPAVGTLTALSVLQEFEDGGNT